MLYFNLMMQLLEITDNLTETKKKAFLLCSSCHFNVMTHDMT